MKLLSRAIGCCAFTFLLTAIPIHQATAITLVSDGFVDGTTTDAGDAEDITWFSQGSATSIAIVSDGTTGPNEAGNDNALELSVGGQGARGVVGLLPSAFSLLSTGYNITLQFDLRYTGDPPGNSAGFRFGFYNSNGTVVAANATNTAGNDLGYAARMATGGNTSFPTIIEEVGAGGPVTSLRVAPTP